MKQNKRIIETIRNLERIIADQKKQLAVLRYELEVRGIIVDTDKLV